MPAEIFRSADRYQEAFTLGLERLLHSDKLGAFILVLANAGYDERLHQLLDERLHRRFEEHAEQLTRELRQGRAGAHAEDDLLVFLELMAMGLDSLEPILHRRAGPWELQYNPLRALRPSRMSRVRVKQLHAPFDAQGFHFNKPFLQDELIWEGELLERHVRLYYNKFPFAPLHALLVPDPAGEHPQFLDEATHLLAWRLLEQVDEHLPFTGLGYNARGAYSSINHLHLQLYSGKVGGYPVEDARWRHNGGDEAWPLEVERYEDPAAAWRRIKELHRGNVAYNLLYRPGRVYITPRALQGSYAHDTWTGGFAWAELAGAITTTRREDFENLRAEAIAGEMRKLAP